MTLLRELSQINCGVKGNEADSKATRIGAKRPKGVGEFFPRAPLGLSRRDWGLKV